MKNKLVQIGLIALLAIFGFSMTACDMLEPGEDPETKANAITVTITGDFSKYVGRKANLAFSLVNSTTPAAYTAPVNVINSTTLITFSMLDYNTDKSLVKSGNYDLILWFEKDGEADIDLYRGNHTITTGPNNIILSSFSTVPKNTAGEVTVTVTGNFSSYSGWEAYISLSAGDVLSAYAFPVNVTTSTTSLSFQMFDFDTDVPFEKAGSYMIWLWFKKTGVDDVDYIIENKAITKGSNTIALSAFTKLGGNGDLPEELIGTWYPVGTVGDFDIDTSLQLFGDGTGIINVYLDITWTVENNKLLITWEDEGGYGFTDEYTYNVTNSILSLTINNKTVTYTQDFISGWPSNDVWASYGLSGFQLPAGASVLHVGSGIDWYHSYKDILYVTLDGDYAAFMDLKNQIEALGYDCDLIEEGQEYSLKVWNSNYNDFLTINYYDTINIEVEKWASIYGTWGKSNYGIFIDWGTESIYFYGVGITSEPFDFFYSDGSIAILNWELEIEYFDFNISMVDDDTLTVTGMPETGDYKLTGFNGVYTRLGM